MKLRHKTVPFLLLPVLGLIATGATPVVLEAVKVQKFGEESASIVHEEGVLFYDAENHALYIGDGITPGGKAVCMCKDPPDYHTFTNTVHINGHTLEFNRHWSQVAEGGSLLYRFGTNTWLRFVGTSDGDFANLDVSDYTFNTSTGTGTMLLTADTTDTDAVLEVSTNLMDAVAWNVATNATVSVRTDASTTWSIDLLGCKFETYRVRTSTIVEAGIHAEKKIIAKGGIEMAGEWWDAWPDLGGYADAKSVAAVASNLAAHAGHTSNPHGVTLEQAVDASEDSYGYMDEEWGVSIFPGDGVSQLRGFGHTISLEESYIEGEFDYWDRPTYVGTGLATTNEVSAAIVPIETRVGELEQMAEEYWCKWKPQNLSLTETNWIPTNNWPAKTVRCYANLTDTNTTYVFAMPDWSPATDYTLHLVIQKAGNVPGFYVRCVNGDAVASSTSTSGIYRDVVFSWQTDIQNWIVTQYSLATAAYYIRGAVRGSMPYSDLPNDEFLPVIVPATPSPASAPAQLQTGSLSPAVVLPMADGHEELFPNIDMENPEWPDELPEPVFDLEEETEEEEVPE